MKHSWTGGQYSLWRAVLAVSLAVSIDAGLEVWIRLTFAVLCLALGLGIRDRVVAWILAAAWWIAESRIRSAASSAVWAPAILVLLHATTHGSPYGTIDALGRPDPGGGWILPRWNFAARRLLLLASTGVALARGEVEIPACLGVALALGAADPGWIPPRRADFPTEMFFDGECGLCHRFVRFLLAEDRTGSRFRFAPLQGTTFLAAFLGDERRGFPDSIVVRSTDGKALLRSRGVLHALSRLGGFWRGIGAVARLVPVWLADLVYDGVAAIRKRVFARPDGLCPIVPAHLARRFDP